MPAMKAANRIAEFCQPERKPLALFTADDLRAVETSCKEQVKAIEANAQAVCREQWKGAVIIGGLIGMGVGQVIAAVVEKFFSF